MPEVVVTVPAPSRKRPRELWDHAEEAQSGPYYLSYDQHSQTDCSDSLHPISRSVVIEDEGEEPFSVPSSSSESSKRRRFSEDNELEIEYLDSVPSSTPPSTCSQLLPLPMTDGTVNNRGRTDWNPADWNNLKRLYARAVELYDRMYYSPVLVPRTNIESSLLQVRLPWMP